VPKNRAGSMLSKRGVKQPRADFLKCLRETKFPELDRHAERDEAFHDPEWLIMLIGVLAVKSQEKTSLGMHRLSTRFWNERCGGQLNAPPISESQWRERCKKISFQPGSAAGYMHQIFPPAYWRSGGQCGQDDAPCAGAGLASPAPKARKNPPRPHRVGHGCELE
jgi:hypothetical protein